MAAERVWEEVARDAGVVLTVPEEVEKAMVEAGRVWVEVVMAGAAVATGVAVGGMVLAAVAME